MNAFCPNIIATTFCCYDKVMWNPLYDGRGPKSCQVDGCTNQAFNTCLDSYPSSGGCWLIDNIFCRFLEMVKPFRGCGKKICIEHSFLLETWNSTDGPWCLCKPTMQGFSCVECEEDLRAAHCCKCGPTVGFTACPAWLCGSRKSRRRGDVEMGGKGQNQYEVANLTTNPNSEIL